MLAISPLDTTTTTTNTRDGCSSRLQFDMDSLPCFSAAPDVEFPDFDSIDFDDFFAGDALPYLEIDPEFLSDFSVCPSTSAGEDETSALSTDCPASLVPSSYNGANSSSDEESKKDEIQSKKSPPVKTKKSSKNSSDNSEGKRKTKVDWTPDLHRRFVQAVEQLGVDKAVPSRILELMGIDCLTRHNVASHLQKYRSHRKHLLAREAEAATWTQKRKMYSMAVVPPPLKANPNHQWHSPQPTMGFPPPTLPPIHHHHHHPFRPLHVWGHPTHPVDHQPSMSIWPKPLQAPPHAWPAPLPAHPPPPHARHHHQPIPCFPHPLPTTRYGLAVPAPVPAPVPGIPPAAIYRPNQQSVGAQANTLDLHPSNESIDAAIGEVLTKPWLPLPIGLKPPETDSVMGELERQGVPAVPPSCA